MLDRGAPSRTVRHGRPLAMRRGAPAIGAELIVVALVLACLGGALALVVTVHRRHAVPKPTATPVVLVPERDVAREDLDRARLNAAAPNSFAILPYKGPNGTWRRPIAIECRDGTATLMPHGPSFSLLELAQDLGGLDPRSSPLTAAV